jgi:hypothetical protein
VLISEILQKTLDIKEYIVDVKRKIHKHPELGMEEYETTAFVKSELSTMGIEMIPLEKNVGVLGIIKGEKSGGEIVTALRADMDALPIQETADVPDKSVVPGVMHACGHDCHTAMLLGAAKVLVSLKGHFSGTHGKKKGKTIDTLYIKSLYCFNHVTGFNAPRKCDSQMSVQPYKLKPPSESTLKPVNVIPLQYVHFFPDTLYIIPMKRRAEEETFSFFGN